MVAIVVPEQGFRRVMHCDLDCFYAAVEELDNPSLVDKPVIVGGDPDRRGVVSTANYIARRFGVHSAMSAAVARRLCPDAIFLRPHFDRYHELSRKVMTILDDYFTVRERVSIDEAYGELPPGLPGCRKAEEIAREIRERVRAELGLVISVGVARNKSLAKLASDLSKPDGCLIVRPGSELPFLHPLAVGKLPGVGPHTRERLEKLGIATVGQLASSDMAELQRQFGKHGVWMWRLANAQDERPVVGEHGPPKSVSHERTYERDIADIERAAEHVRTLAGEVAARVAAEEIDGRTVTLKVKWSDFRQMTRQCALAAPTHEAGPIAEAALRLLREEVAPLLTTDSAAIRLLGVGLSGFGVGEDLPSWGGIVQLRMFGEQGNEGRRAAG
ncbi:MAG: DNA polymerase IV [Ktedonobacterales bacterium]